MQKQFFSTVKKKWLQVLLGGITLFITTQSVFNVTGNRLFFPMLLLFGAFTVPVVFLIFLYEHGLTRDITHSRLAICFFIGGAVGVLVGGLLEYELLKIPGVFNLLFVSLIEETSKLIVPLFEYIYSRHRAEKDGLIFGVYVGMGFASLETMGYGLVELLMSDWDILSLDKILLVRAVLSPVSHAAWTGLVTAVIWRERGRRGHAIFSPAVLLAFITAVFLHFAWDVANAQEARTANGFLIAAAGVIAVGVCSLYFLIRRIKESIRGQKRASLTE